MTCIMMQISKGRLRSPFFLRRHFGNTAKCAPRDRGRHWFQKRCNISLIRLLLWIFGWQVKDAPKELIGQYGSTPSR